MVSRSLKEGIPSKVILLSESDTIPDGYSLYSCFNGKYIKQVPTACTNPGTCVGNSTHTHACNSHSHTTTGGGAHTHSVSLGGYPGFPAPGSPTSRNTTPSGGIVMMVYTSSPPHSHAASNSCPSGAGSGSTGPSGNHNHGTKCNDPAYRSKKLIQKNCVVSFRKKNIPHNYISMWPNALCTIPSNLSINTANFSKLIGGVATDCTTPGSNLGNANHTHTSAGHTHTVSYAPHTHNFTSIGAAPPLGPGVPDNQQSVGPGSLGMSKGHHHGTVTSGGASALPSTNCDAHTHDSISLDPANKTIAFLDSSIISMRKTGFVKGQISLWACNVACIPTGLQLADGTNCTSNYLDKWPKGIPDACTNPGTCGGSNTHTHSCVASSHAAVAGSHTHPSGATPSSVTGPRVGGPGPQGGYSGDYPCPAWNHPHPTSYSSSGSPISITAASGHTHGAQCHKPNSKEIGLIQKL